MGFPLWACSGAFSAGPARPRPACGAASCAATSRPAIANERLGRNGKGQVLVQLRSPWRDGTTHIALRNILAVVAGIVVGGAVNMLLVMLGPAAIPPPPGVDMTTAEGLAKGMPLLEAKHFVFPFLAHALGTLAGALAAFLVAGSRHAVFALVIGAVFLAGNIAAAYMIPAPAWFIVLDLVAAYIPMAWLGTVVARRLKRRPVPRPSAARLVQKVDRRADGSISPRGFAGPSAVPAEIHPTRRSPSPQ